MKWIWRFVIFLKPKEHYDKPSSSSVYDEKRKYTWEGQLKPAAKVLDLGTVTWEQAWVWLKKSGIRNVER